MGRPSGFSPSESALIISRDGGRCFRCGKAVDLTARGVAFSLHHRQPRGMGGTSRRVTVACGVTLCGSGTAGCHGWVETHRQLARELGYLVPLNGVLKPAEVAIVRWDGAVVRLTDDGDVVPIGET
jgi:hypothetical protein